MKTFEITPYSEIREYKLTNVGLTHVHLVFDIRNYDVEKHDVNQYHILGSGGEHDRFTKGDVNIPVHDHHRCFSNKKLAEEYSNWMKSDEEYIESVRAWHKHCNEIFRDIDYDDYDYDYDYDY
jgi:hypothetical protein